MLIPFQRWARAYRDTTYHVAVDTNNGVEAQNKLLKYNYLPRRKQITLSEVITILVESFLPEMYQKYLFQNYAMTTAYRPYNEDIPDFLRDCPHKLVVHCTDRIRKSRKFRNEDIQMEDSCGEFNVTTASGKVHKVDFGNATGTPSCTCMDWVRYHIPCKHFFAIFNHQENWSWHSLPPAYLTSPLLSIDHKALASEFPNVTLDASETPFETMSEELMTELKPLPEKKVTWPH